LPATPFPGATATGTCAEQIGAEVARGVELEVNARPTKSWQVTAGYAYSDAKVTASKDPAQVGALLTNNAKHNFNLWSRYDLRRRLEGPGSGWAWAWCTWATAWGSSRRPMRTTGVVDNRTMPMPSYTVVDLGVYYNIDRYAFTLKVGNVGDKTYYESAGFTGDINIVPGVPRNFSLSMRVHF
jgi:iron complex outermembrane receptor protein